MDFFACTQPAPFCFFFSNEKHEFAGFLDSPFFSLRTYRQFMLFLTAEICFARLCLLLS